MYMTCTTWHVIHCTCHVIVGCLASTSLSEICRANIALSLEKEAGCFWFCGSVTLYIYREREKRKHVWTCIATRLVAMQVHTCEVLHLASTSLDTFFWQVPRGAITNALSFGLQEKRVLINQEWSSSPQCISKRTFSAHFPRDHFKHCLTIISRIGVGTLLKRVPTPILDPG